MNTHTRYGEATGAFHSGTGDIHYNLFGAAAPQDETRDPRRVARDTVHRLKRRHVPPEGAKRAGHLLETRNTVLVTAAPGDGAGSTARVLLWGFPYGEERFQVLVDQSQEEGGGRALNPEQIEEEASLFLDLSGVTEERYGVFMRELPHFRARVCEKRARLAVVLGHGKDNLLNDELADLVVPLGRPDAREVLRRHLLDDGVSFSSQELVGRRLTEFLDRAPMSQIAALSNRVRDIRDRRRNRDGFRNWLEAALTASRPGSTHVTARLKKLPEGSQRALLLTAALLEGARADTVHDAANRLLRISAHPEKYCPALEQQPLGDRLGEIGARVEEGRVQFSEPEFAQAVRTHFWDEFPHLRPKLRSWIEEAEDLPALGRRDLLHLVTRYTQECLRTGPAEDLLSLATHWTRKEASQRQWSMAARALGRGVGDPRHGSRFRRRIYEWSKEGGLPRGRAEVLIGVCSEALAVHFPQQALVRLHHLSHQQDEPVQEAAREALARITRSDDHLYGRFLERLDPLRERTGQHDILAFLHVAAPDRLLGDATVRQQLTGLWAAAMRYSRPPEWRPAFSTWLTEAHKDPGGNGRAIIQLLADACGRDGPTLGPMYAAVCEWADGDHTGARRCTADALWHRATTVLGINPSTHPR